MHLLAFATLALGLALAGGIHAAEGVIEINQATALAGGGLPGDVPGFPVTISSAGNYALTSALVVGNPALDAILVTSSGVTLDLRGFQIRGPYVCGGATCSPGGPGGRGIAILASRARVSRGDVRGFVSHGIEIGSDSVVEGLIVSQNGGSGVVAGQRTRVIDSIAELNGELGIDGGVSLVRGCLAFANRAGGILARSSAVVSGNTVLANSGFGIAGQSGVVVDGNVVTGNAQDGIALSGAGGLVAGNSVHGNGWAGVAMTLTGLVQGNAVTNNPVASLFLIQSSGAPAAYRENVLGGTAATEVSGGQNLGNNACDGVSCP